jgi:hypothetical protein
LLSRGSVHGASNSYEKPPAKTFPVFSYPGSWKDPSGIPVSVLASGGIQSRRITEYQDTTNLTGRQSSRHECIADVCDTDIQVLFGFFASTVFFVSP